MSDAVSRTIGALQAAGFRGERLKTAFGIVMRESGGNPLAHNPDRSTGDDSYGLAQINMLGAMGPARRRQFGIRSNAELLDPNVNARAMFQMSHGGKDFGAWGIGPHAYRQGAGYDTIARYVNQFPGAHPAGGTGPVARAPSSPLPPVPPSLSPQAAARRAYGLALLAQIVARRGGSPLMRTVLARAAEQPDEQPPPKQPPLEDPEYADVDENGQLVLGVPGEQRRLPGLAPGRGDVQLPLHYRPTHVTDGLGWGTKTARDFMAKPGTGVDSPVNGIIRYFHPEGAQGGGSMLIDALNGKRQVWLGHIARGLRPGTRVRRGQRVAVVANQHVSAPHVHEDVRLIG